MSIGQRKCKVAIQQLTAGQDSIGQPTQTWTTLASVWADIRYLNGMQTIRNDAQMSATKASVRIRRRTDVTTAMRVVYGTTEFAIVAVLPDEQDRNRLDLSCEVLK